MSDLIHIPEEDEAKVAFLKKCAEIYKPFKASLPIKESHTAKQGCRLFLFPSGSFEPSYFFAKDEWLMVKDADKCIESVVKSKEFAEYCRSIGCSFYKVETKKKHETFYNLNGTKLTKSKCWGSKEYRLRLFIS